MTLTEIVTVTNPPFVNESTRDTHRSTSWVDLAKLPILFTKSLFEPFTNENAQNFYQKQVTQIKKKKITGYTWNVVQHIGRTIKEHPLNAFILTGAMLLGCTEIGNYTKLLPAAIVTANTIKNGKFLKSLANSIDNKTLIGRVVKIAFYGGAALYFLSSIPIASASLKDCTCDKSLIGLMNPLMQCIQNGGNLHECRASMPEETLNEFYVFARHDNDHFSLVQLNKNKTCIYTALEKTSDVTKTCFIDLENPDSWTVERVQGFPLTKTIEGLAPGQKVEYFGIEITSTDYACGYNPIREADYDLGNQPLCQLTALKPSGDVSQVCFDPKHPQSLTLKQLNGFSLIHPGNGPISVVIKNPEEFGLKIDADCTPNTLT